MKTFRDATYQTVARKGNKMLQYTINYDRYEGWNFNSDNYLFTTDTK